MRYIAFITLILITFTAYSETAIEGWASYYGAGERLNDNVAMNIPFNENLLECASWDYPLGAILKVTNLENGKVIYCRVTDRGPAKRLNRLLDLTAFAFSQIADLDKGLIQIRVEKVKNYNKRYAGR